MFCSQCGTSLSDAAAFCSACGQPVPGVGVAGVPSPVVAPTAAPVAVPVAAYAAARAPVAYAGFWLRFVALIIDSIVMSIAGGIVIFPFVATMGLRRFSRGAMMRPEDMFPVVGMIFRFILISAILKWLYYAVLESSSWQGTLGKMVLGLQVTDLDGHRISFGRATGRTFGKIISAMILWIGFIMAGFTEKKQALHDMMAGCLVIKKE